MACTATVISTSETTVGIRASIAAHAHIEGVESSCKGWSGQHSEYNTIAATPNNST